MKILIIKRGAIGDVLMSTPLVRQLNHKADVHLEFLVGRGASIALINNPYIKKIHVVDDKLFGILGGFKLAKFLYKKKHDYDYVFFLDKHWYFHLIGYFSLKSVFVGFSRNFISKIFLKYCVNYHDVTRYQALYYLDLLNISKIADVDYNDIGLDFVITQEDQKYANTVITQYTQDQKYVAVVNSGGNNQFELSGIRMLPEPIMLNLLKKLLDAGKIVILLGGMIDQKNYKRYIKHFNFNQNLIDLSGKLSLSVSAAIIDKSAFFYTTDCGALHLAVALRKNMCAFFGPTNPYHVLPRAMVSNIAIWHDKDRYCEKYQLYGKLRRHKILYFNGILDGIDI